MNGVNGVGKQSNLLANSCQEQARKETQPGNQQIDAVRSVTLNSEISPVLLSKSILLICIPVMPSDKPHCKQAGEI